MGNRSRQLQLGLDDLLGDLHHARRQGDLGRLALLLYCEVRRWARQAGQEELAEHSSELITHAPYGSRAAFLSMADDIIVELSNARPLVSAAVLVPRPEVGVADLFNNDGRDKQPG